MIIIPRKLKNSLLEAIVFSGREREILKIIGRRKMSMTEIKEKVFENSTDGEPLNANILISVAIRQIIKKCEKSRLPWTLDGEGTGRHGRTVWRAKRKRARSKH